MISRRNIRVKVMQTLYTITAAEAAGNPAAAFTTAQPILRKHFDQTRFLLVYMTWFITEVSRYAETEAHKRASKHLPTAEDLRVNTKIAGNELLWKMLEDPALQEQFKSLKPEQTGDPELVRKLYLQLAESETYKKYVSEEKRNPAEEKKIIEYILQDLLLPSESFLSHMEESFSNWEDDAEMVIQILAGYIQKPGSCNFREMPTPDKELFGNNLLRTVLEKGEHLQTLITPKLKNWDPDRIALLDMILMKMGVAEFLYFETIPPKVTINEYIDLAKEYSTAQSGQFVNGILDNIHKELVQQGKMQKVEYKKPG